MPELICRLLELYLIILIVRAIMSWFPIERGGVADKIQGFLFMLTEPVLRPIRGMLPPVRMGGIGLDLSFMVVFFGIIILQRLIC